MDQTIIAMNHSISTIQVFVFYVLESKSVIRTKDVVLITNSWSQSIFANRILVVV